MKELKVGMYVRTKKGIAKILGRVQEPDNYYFKMLITDKYLEINDDTEYIHDLDIIKASENIIDLIEENDVVMYKYYDEVYISKAEKCGTAKMLRVNLNYDVSINCVEILKVLTHEQFEDNAYEV